MWMCICVCPYSVTAALIDQAFGIFPRNLVTSQGASQSVLLHLDKITIVRPFLCLVKITIVFYLELY